MSPQEERVPRRWGLLRSSPCAFFGHALEQNSHILLDIIQFQLEEACAGVDASDSPPPVTQIPTPILFSHRPGGEEGRCRIPRCDLRRTKSFSWGPPAEETGREIGFYLAFLKVQLPEFGHTFWRVSQHFLNMKIETFSLTRVSETLSQRNDGLKHT